MRKGFWLSLMLALFVVVMPIAAQNEETEVTACTEEELTVTTDAIGQLATAYQEVGETMGDGSDPDALTAAVLGFDALSTGFWTEIYPELPACVESITLSNHFSLAIDESVISIGLARLALYEAEYGDADLAQSYADYAAARADWYAEVVQTTFGAISETGELPESMTGTELPSCTEEDATNEAVVATTDSIAAYQQLGTASVDASPEEMTQLVGGFAALSGAFRVGIYPALPCAEAAALGSNIALLYDRTLITVLLARLSLYEAENGDADVATLLSDAAVARLAAVQEFGAKVFPATQE